jgi:hypothetical protein
VDLRAGLDDVEKRKFLILLGLEIRPRGHPARNQSLYRLHYPGFRESINKRKEIPGSVSRNADTFKETASYLVR